MLARLEFLFACVKRENAREVRRTRIELAGNANMLIGSDVCMAVLRVSPAIY